MSGGLGPTHDDITVEMVARATGRELVHDVALHRQIEQRSRVAAGRLGRPYSEFEPGVTKQATVPEGATVVGLSGTAPALIVECGACMVVTLPGPPRELQALWPAVLEVPDIRVILDRAHPAPRHVLRFYGVPESSVAAAIAAAGGEGADVTICARDFEIHVDIFEGDAGPRHAARLAHAIAQALPDYLYATTESTVEELVLASCAARGIRLATAESCTGGLIAERLTAIPGASEVFVGGVVAYADDVKAGILGVPADVLRTHGAVSAETALAMAHGARARLGVEVAVAVTGIAGQGGATDGKPVGLVFLHAVGPRGDRSAVLDVPGDRETIRRRAATAALHLCRTLVTES